MYISTTVKIKTEFSATITYPLITITDPDENVLVDGVAMILESGNEYYYLFQSLSTHTAGRYGVEIKATSGDYTISDKDFFTLSNY